MEKVELILVVSGCKHFKDVPVMRVSETRDGMLEIPSLYCPDCLSMLSARVVSWGVIK